MTQEEGEKMYKRRQSREVSVGNVKIGGNNPISIQSMTNTDTRDAEATIAQIKRLEEVGCDIVRVAIPDMTAAKNIAKIKSEVNIPVIADIHFDYRLALEVIDQGVDGVRINPGNIGSIDRVKMVVEKCKEKNLKIRIGVNGGSLEKELLQKYGSATAEALVESAMNHVKILEDLDFRNIVISLKSSDIYKTLEAYELISKQVDYPLHIGITESGSVKKGTIKSSIGVGALLLKGIGDTIRISLTGDPCEEVIVGKEILRSLDLLNDKIKVVSCPTCGRCNIDLISVVNEVEEKINHMEKDITVAIMGCAVNGPGEAREADIVIAGGKEEGLLFKKGEIIRKIKQEDISSKHAIENKEDVKETGLENITAFVGTNDFVAIGIMDAITSLGYRIPEDFSVCGFDNTLVASFSGISLTTIDHCIGEKGAYAVSMLMNQKNRMEQKDGKREKKRPIMRLEYEPQLIVRHSTGRR